MAIIKITGENYESEVMQSDRPVLIDFWTDWCGPCQMLTPIMEEVADELSDIKVCKINVDEENSLAMQYGVMSIPTLLFVKDGKVIDTSVGLSSKAEILDMIRK